MNRQLTDLTTISCQLETQLAARGLKQILEYLEQKQVKVISENGDIQLQIEPDLYSTFSISIDKNIVISAGSEKAVFQASMYFITLISTQQSVEKEITGQLPQSRNMLMIDIGRKFYSLESLKKLVEEMALFQFDTLQLHFSENFGFRIECELHPEIVSEAHLSKAEVRELIQYAHAHFIDVIPDFDSPGHMEHILKQHPEWALKMIDEDGKEVNSPRALDIFNEAAVAFMRSIYEEYGKLFQESRYFHVGADEFVPFDQVDKYPVLKAHAVQKFGPKASGIEAFIEYVNGTIDFVRNMGFIPMVWNDGFFRLNSHEELSLSSDCVICYWTRWNKNMAPIETFIKRGYQTINYNDNYLYYVLGEHASYTYPTYEKIKAGWTPELFASNQPLAKKNIEQLTGTAVAIWSDIPEAKTELEVNQDIFFILAAVMQKRNNLDLGEKENLADLYTCCFR